MSCTGACNEICVILPKYRARKVGVVTVTSLSFLGWEFVAPAERGSENVWVRDSENMLCFFPQLPLGALMGLCNI